MANEKDKTIEKPNEIPNLDIDESLKSLFKPNDSNSELFKAVTTFYDEIETKTDITNANVQQIIKLVYFGEESKRFELDDKMPKISSIIDSVFHLQSLYGNSLFTSTTDSNSRNDGYLNLVLPDCLKEIVNSHFTFLTGISSCKSLI